MDLDEYYDDHVTAYKQGVHEFELAEMVGKSVLAVGTTIAGEEWGFKARVIGYSKSVIHTPKGQALRWGVITDEGMEFFIMKDAELRVVEDEG